MAGENTQAASCGPAMAGENKEVASWGPAKEELWRQQLNGPMGFLRDGYDNILEWEEARRVAAEESQARYKEMEKLEAAKDIDEKRRAAALAKDEAEEDFLRMVLEDGEEAKEWARKQAEAMRKRRNAVDVLSSDEECKQRKRKCRRSSSFESTLVVID